jgi:hypothetical protein
VRNSKYNPIRKKPEIEKKLRFLGEGEITEESRRKNWKEANLDNYSCIK